MSYFTVGFMLGVLLLQQFSFLPAPFWLLALPPALLLLYRMRLPVAAKTMLGGLACGFSIALLVTYWRYPAELPVRQFSTGTVWAQGYIDSLPVQKPGFTRFLFRIRQLQWGVQHWQGDWRVQLSWYRDAPHVQAGQVWRLPLRIKKVRGYRNPGGFDLEGWLFAQDVRYKAWVKGEGQYLGEQFSIHHWRQQLSERLTALPMAAEVRAVFRALVVGDRSGLSQAQKDNFAATGTSHLMAISGLHIGIVAGLVFVLVGGLWRLVPQLVAVVPHRVAAAPAAMLAATGYALLAGFTLPTQRALLMLGIALLVLSMRRSLSPAAVLSLALVVVLSWQPMAVLSAGFWLSFVAVAALLFWASRGWRGATWWGSQLAIFVALAPVLLWFGMQWSWISPVVNLVAIPLFAILIVPLLLLGSLWVQLWPDAGLIPLQMAADLLARFLLVLQWLGEQQWSLHGHQAAAWWILLGLAAMLLVATLWQRRWHWAGWLLALIALLMLKLISLPTPPPLGSFRLTLLDVGQGLSAVVRTHSRVLLYDTGPGYASGFNTGQAVVAPYLRSQGLGQLQLVLLSHADSDHIGGLRGLLGRIAMQRLMSGEAAELDIERHVQPCHQGQGWEWDGVHFEILYPPADVLFEGNNASCVLRVSTGSQSLLLTGDIEADGERWLLRQASEKLPATVVVAAHHGSASSSTEDFVAATHPAWVLYAAGADNRWGFPRPVVQQRWQSVAARSLNTADQGAIEIEFLPERLGKIETWMQTHGRYWHR